MVVWSFFYIILINSISFFVFGNEKTIEYYVYWYTEIASSLTKVNQSCLYHHMNQSFFAMMGRLLTKESGGLSIYVNLFDLDINSVKIISYTFVVLISFYPAYLFRKMLINRGSSSSLLEYSIIFNIIPLLSPLAWKGYFIFLWLPYFMSYLYLYQLNKGNKGSDIKIIKFLFIVSLILNVFSTDAFIGVYLKNVLELYSCITIGTILLLVVQLAIFSRSDINNLKLIERYKDTSKNSNNKKKCSN